MRVYIWILLLAIVDPSAHARSRGKRGDAITELIKKKSVGTKNTVSSGGISALDAIRNHREKKEKAGKPKRSLTEIEDELLERRDQSRGGSSFGAPKTVDNWKLFTKRKPGKVIDNSLQDDQKDDLGNVLDDDAQLAIEEAVDREDAEDPLPNVSPINKKRFTYSIHQSDSDRESWRQLKIYIIIGSFLCLCIVAGVSYYRSRNKMLLPGKLM